MTAFLSREAQVLPGSLSRRPFALPMPRGRVVAHHLGGSGSARTDHTADLAESGGLDPQAYARTAFEAGPAPSRFTLQDWQLAEVSIPTRSGLESNLSAGSRAKSRSGRSHGIHGLGGQQLPERDGAGRGPRTPTGAYVPAVSETAMSTKIPTSRRSAERGSRTPTSLGQGPLRPPRLPITPSPHRGG